MDSVNQVKRHLDAETSSEPFDKALDCATKEMTDRPVASEQVSCQVPRLKEQSYVRSQFTKRSVETVQEINLQQGITESIEHPIKDKVSQVRSSTTRRG